MHRVIRYLAVALLLIAALPLRAAEDVEDVRAAEDDEYAVFYRVEFVLGNVAFATLHELAHAIYTDWDVPVLGNSEDAADTLVVVTLIMLDRRYPEQGNRHVRLLLTTANANLILWRRGLEKDNPVIFSARHPLTVQRAARINCLVFGSDPEFYEPLPDLVGLPDMRADWCEEEYADAEHAWRWVRRITYEENPGTASDHQYIYGAAREPAHELLRGWLIRNQILERTLAKLPLTKVFRDIFALRTRSCGYSNAYWDMEARELVLCYELIDAFFKLSAEQSMRELDKQFRAFHRDAPAPSMN